MAKEKGDLNLERLLEVMTAGDVSKLTGLNISVVYRHNQTGYVSKPAQYIYFSLLREFECGCTVELMDRKRLVMEDMSRKFNGIDIPGML